MAKGDRTARHPRLSQARKSAKSKLCCARAKICSNKNRKDETVVSNFVSQKNIEKSSVNNRETPSTTFFTASISEKDIEESGCSLMSTDNDNSEFLITTNNVGYSKSKDSENATKSFFPVGRRIVDIEYWFRILLNHKHSGLFDCSFSDMEIIKEKQKGLLSLFTLKCKICKSTLELHSEDPMCENLDVNKAAVSAITLTGGGYSQLEEMTAVLNMPCMSSDMFLKCQEKVNNDIEKSAWLSMKQAGEEEAQLARDRGDVDINGVPYITVVADGAWCKRSYRVNYNASSGVACIVGQQTGKILFIGIRNKYCCICDRAKTLSKSPAAHKCFKNWDGPSTAMESDIIVQGFKCSLEMHGIMYSKLIGDGDSSVHRKLIEARPYGYNLIVEKIECANHLLRNYCSNLRELSVRRYSSTGKFVNVNLRHLLSANIRRLRCAVEYAAKYRRKETSSGIIHLKADILNSINHVFGDHNNCASYFCKRLKGNEVNFVIQIKNCGLYDDIMSLVNRLVFHVKSLYLNMTNNAAERYNSVLTKFTGGKRINFATRSSYKSRCFAAALSFNSRGRLHYFVHKAIIDKSPAKITKKYIERAENKFARRKLLFRKKSRSVTAPADKNYGPNAAEVQKVSPEKYEIDKNNFLFSLRKNSEEIKELERNTVEQFSTQLWHTERLKRLTASNFGRVCKLRETTSCAVAVKNILYSQFFGNSSTKYGIEKEPMAIQCFESLYNLKVDRCGLFVDAEDSFLAASPDGLIGTDGIIEIKCPANSSKLTPQDAIIQKKITFAEIKDNSFSLKRNNNYYYQVQGQLHITGRSYCFFICWTPHGMLVEKITRDDNFWDTKMKNSLRTFYNDCILPEIIDPQHPKNMPIKDPIYRKK